jgi:hypothetical protein
MFLKNKESGDIIEVMDTKSLFDPNRTNVKGRFHHGEELQDPDQFEKSELIFPSGEALPQCWLDPHYRE